MSPSHGHDDGPAPSSGRLFPRVPAYAWRWFQRSRPVVNEAARRLTGRDASASFVDELRATFDHDPFVQAILADVVVEVAFSGQVPSRRPPGASWDRGLSWWGAALAGVPLATFEGDTGRGVSQHALFPTPDATGGEQADDAVDLHARARERAVSGVPRSAARLALAAVLRDLLAQAEGGQIPAEAVRQVLAHLEQDPQEDPQEDPQGA